MKTKKAIRLASLLVVVAALAVINVVGIILGLKGKDNATFITVLILSNVMVLLEEGLILLETKGKRSVFYRLLGTPLHVWALATIGLQVVFLLIVIIRNLFFPFPMTAIAIVEVILFALFIVQAVFGYLAREFSFGVDQKIDAKTHGFEEYRKRVQIILIKDASKEFKDKMGEISEKMRYMSPVSDKATEEVDASIDAKIGEIEVAIKAEEKDDNALLALAKELKELLAEREILSVK